MESWSVLLFTIVFGEGPIGISLKYSLDLLGSHMNLLQFILVWQAVSIPLTVFLFWAIVRYHSKYAMTDRDFQKLIKSKTPGKFFEWMGKH